MSKNQSQVRYWYKTNETRSIWVNARSVAGLITSAVVAIAYFAEPRKYFQQKSKIQIIVLLPNGCQGLEHTRIKK